MPLSHEPDFLPQDFPAWTLGAAWESDEIGESDCDVYRIEAEDGTTAYAKIGPIGALDADRTLLTWLAGKLPVPKLLYYGSDAARDFLLMSTIEGEQAASADNLAMPERTVIRYAEALRMIHAVPVAGCPIDRRLDHALAEAADRVRRGLIDTSDFEPVHAGITPEQLLAELVDNRPQTEHLVFAHGDYCMPNLLLSGGEISGMIDWVRGGIADRYQDIALAVRSLNHNRLRDLVPLFLSTYGIEEPDEARIRYYIQLDELF